MENTKFIRSSIGISIVVIFGLVLSFAQSAVFAAYYGVNYQADAYVMASQIPIVLFAIIAVGIRTVVLPIYTKRLIEDGKDHATLFGRNILTIAVLLAGLFAVLGILLADPIVYLFAPGFDVEKHTLAVNLLRILFPIVVFTIQADIYNAILNSWRVFFWPQIAINFQNITLIVIVFAFTSQIGIYAAAIGILCGIIARSIYLMLLVRKNFMYRPYLNFKDPDIRKSGKMAFPVTLGMGVSQINTFIDRSVASGLTTGSISALNYASNLNGIFSGLLVQSIATVVYPSIAGLVVKKDFPGLNRLINAVLSALILIVLPLMGGLYICNREFVAILFERGVFDQSATLLTGNILVFFNLGILFTTVWEIISRVYYSFNDTKTPMINASIGFATQIGFIILLSRFMGAPGLALATTLSSGIICCMLLFNLRKKYDGYNLGEALVALIKGAIGTVGMLAVLALFGRLVPIRNAILFILSYAALGTTTYLILLSLVRTKEVSALWEIGLKFIRRRREKLALGRKTL